MDIGEQAEMGRRGFAAARSGWEALIAVLTVVSLLLTAAVASASPPPLNTLYNFGEQDFLSIGNFQDSRLLQASDGNLYGVSAYGGANFYGFVYKITLATGQITHLHDFDYTEGATPRGSLVQGSDGYLYGTTEAGGANYSSNCLVQQFYGRGNGGTVFKSSMAGAFTKLHDFYTPDDGYQCGPPGGVVQAADGNFYGVAVQAYPGVVPSIFKMTPAGVVTIVSLFPSDGRQGTDPYNGVTLGKDGYLYGTMTGGGAKSQYCSAGCGTVYRASTTGSIELLYSFKSGASGGTGDGAFPWSELYQGQNGNFYGTTYTGGYSGTGCTGGGCGTVYMITPAGTETVLYAFKGTSSDGFWPLNSGVTQTADGSLYGVTGGNPYGSSNMPGCYIGSATQAFGCGTVYKIDSAGTLSLVDTFALGIGIYGIWPQSSMIAASDGNVYGTTISYGGGGYGTVYRVLLNSATPIVAISGVQPAGGPPGTGVTLTGIGFTGATKVTLGNGTSAESIPFTVQSDTQIIATVQSDAQSSAFSVTAPRCTTYADAYFYLQPIIDSMTPTRGRVGSGVTLNGAHFDGITSITFGGTVATSYTYVNSGDGSINVTVPRGAKTGPIVVTNPGGSASSQTFTVVGGGR